MATERPSNSTFAGCAGRVLGKQLVHVASVGSTNQMALELARGGAPEGTLVLADEQIAGKGRLGRAWLTPAGSSLLFSVILRPRLASSRTTLVTMIAGTAVAAAIEQVTGLTAELKWPNDVLIHGKKVCGILAQTTVARGGGGAGPADRTQQTLVVGIGLNVNFRARDIGLATATTLQDELGRPIDRAELLRVVLGQLEARYFELKPDAVFEEWRGRLLTLGQRVSVSVGLRTVEGVAENVQPDGSLVVRLATGEAEVVAAGDIGW